jgi:hypothetical protein
MIKEKNKTTKSSKIIIKEKDCSCYNTFDFAEFFMGTVIILIGLGYLLNSLGIIYTKFDFWEFWPLLIVFAGLSLFNKKSIFSNIVGGLVLLIAIFFIGMVFLTPTGSIHTINKNTNKAASLPAPIALEQKPAENTQKVELFYYNQLKDKNSTCNGDYVLPIERQIPITKTPIKDTLNLLISGELTPMEKNQGFTTEFPNNNFKLLEANYDYDSETLILKFTEVPGFTDGGSCRVGILANEIIKTAKQFGIKNVIFSPETLFQP